jgi:hypothetical protein
MYVPACDSRCLAFRHEVRTPPAEHGSTSTQHTYSQMCLPDPERLVGHPEVEQFPITARKRRYRVRLNGADHQWGKDPPKEVVG